MSVVHLRPPKGQGIDPPAARPRSTVSLTDAEAMRLRAALRNLKSLYGTWTCLADVMGVSPRTLQNFISSTRRGASPGMAVAAARAAGTTVDALLGGPKVAGSCPHCGAAWEVRSS
jgi:hypothetical protein